MSLKNNNLMKKIVLTMVAALSLIISLNAYMKPMENPISKDKNGHELSQLWKQYSDAQAKDRPLLQVDILQKIIAQSKSEKLVWDYYDAWRKYIDVSSSRNWKLRDSLEKAFVVDLEEFSEPVATVSWHRDRALWNTAQALEYVKSNADRLKNGRNEAFYDNVGGVSYMLEGNMPKYLSNDYEYILWTLVNFRNEEDMAVKLLKDYFQGAYPNAAYLDYMLASSLPIEERKTALEELVKVNSGNAIAFYAEGELLTLKKHELDQKKASSEEYKALYEELQLFEKRRRAVGGKDAELLTPYLRIVSLISVLEAAEVRINVVDDTALLYLRNMPDVDVKLYEEDQKKAFFSKTLQNHDRSFYVYDSLKPTLPLIDDGTYRLQAGHGKVEEEIGFEKYSLSIAGRRDRDNYSVYLADHKSGKPVEYADLSLFKNGSEIARTEHFIFNGGFTPLPSEFNSKISEKSNYWIEASLVGSDDLVKKTRRILVTGEYAEEYLGSDKGKYCNIYTDRSAYNPGDTIHFKAVLYNGDLMNSVAVAEENIKVVAVLRDSEGVERASLNLKTNEFGSIAGEFVVAENLRNGRFTISISGGGYNSTKSIRVDELVLPEFDLEFDPIDELFVPGEKVEVGGRLISYSGHTLTSVNASYVVEMAGNQYAADVLEIAPDGTFAISFPTDEKKDWQYYDVVVKVVDHTGQTREFSIFVTVGRHYFISMKIQNGVEADYKTLDAFDSLVYPSTVVEDDYVILNMLARNDRNTPISAEISYSLYDENDKLLFSSVTNSSEDIKVDLSEYESGLYTLKAESLVKGVKAQANMSFVKLSRDAEALNAPLEYFFRAIDLEVEAGENIELQFATADGPIWAVLELFGSNREVLKQELIYLDGDRAKPGSLTKLSYPYEETYPDAVFCQLFYFKNSRAQTFNCQYRRVRHNLDLPLVWNRFEDKTLPSKSYEFELHTNPNVEILASIYDKSTDEIAVNIWNKVSMRQFHVPSVIINSRSGGNSSSYYFTDGAPIVAYGASRSLRAVNAARKSVTVESSVADMIESEEAVEEEIGGAGKASAAKIRENFAKTIAFEPFLRSDEDGKAVLLFTTSDKLSTFKVMLYAHDQKMKNALLSKDMLVSIPVKVSVLQPKYLYLGDSYKMAVSLSSMADEEISGTLFMYQYDGKEHEGKTPTCVKSERVTIAPRSDMSHSFDVEVPKLASDLGVKLVFEADGNNATSFSDAVFFSIPVWSKDQSLTESHSIVLLPGMDKDKELEKLRKSFVNVSHYGAEYEEKSVMDMVRDAIPERVDVKADDLISLSEAYYIRKAAAKLGVQGYQGISDEELLDKILSCRNADGGFSWFEGMESSAVMTAMMLERFAKIADLGYEKIDLSSSVHYLDKAFFSLNRPIWGGGVSTEQYLYIRSLYAMVPFEYEPLSTESEKRFKEFKKYASDYLLPKKERALNGEILAKARRLKTLANLMSQEGGLHLADALGLRVSSEKKLYSSLTADVASLLEYAVEHGNGGIYYPNAVMPYRGLMESEAYAHSLICDLFTDYAAGFGLDIRTEMVQQAESVAKGIRIWLMLQKETQHWETDPAYIDAIHSVLSHPDGLEDIEVLILSKTYEKPFTDIKAYGNEFTIERHVYRNDEEIVDGAKLKVGDRLTIRYEVWNKENRSFVLLRAPREATLSPVNQLSGLYGPSWRALNTGRGNTFYVTGYRNVKSSETEFYFDSYPEEATTIVEEFYVTQEGIFTAPVVEIESLYAKHYRANSGSSPEMKVN